MTNKALEAMDAKKLTPVVLLDLSKAFDSLDHHEIIIDLQQNLRHWVLVVPLWNRSYLLGRQQYVRISAKASSLGAVSYGVPQGSILGPSLLTIFINDLSSIQNLVLWNHTLKIQNSVCHFLSTIYAVWSSRLLTIYRSQRLGATCYNILT